jgi:UrcA family protein
MSQFSLKIPLLGTVLGIAAASAAFASPVSVPHQVVRYDAAALSSDAGARAVYAQISRAAEKVCPNTFSLLNNKLVQACREQAVADAVAKIHNPRLAAVHAAASSKSG